MSLGTVAVGAGMSASGGFLESVGNAFIPNASPSLGEVHTLYASGFFNYQNARDLVRFLGLTTRQDEWEKIDYRQTVPDTPMGPFATLNLQMLNRPTTWKTNWMRSYIPMPSIHEANEMLKRNLISEGLYDYYVSRQTGSNAGMTKAWKDLRYELGGPTDWIRFAVREAFTPHLITQFGYNKEFPKAITPYLQWLGLDKSLGMNQPNGSTNDDGTPRTDAVTVMDLHWWSHWDLPSNTQGYEMSHRLYSTSRFGPAPGVTNETKFDPSDLELLQRANDIPEYWRKRLQAIAYNPLTRVDVRRMYALGVITDDAELYHAYRAIGYDDRNAMYLVEFTKANAAPKFKENLAATKGELCDAYSNGFIQRITVSANLRLLKWNENEINNFISWCDTKQQIRHNKIMMKYIKKNLLSGNASWDETRTALVNLQIRSDALARIMSQWGAELNAQRKYLSAKDLLELYENYIIDEFETRQKLFNLAFSDIDISRMINLRKRRMLSVLNKALEKALKERIQEQQRQLKLIEQQKKEQQKLIEKQTSKREREQAEIQRKILSAFTDKNLKDFYKVKVLTAPQISSILQSRGWNSTAIVGWMRANIDKDYASGNNSSGNNEEE